MDQKEFTNLPPLPLAVWKRGVEDFQSLRDLMKNGKGWGHPEYEARYSETKQFTRTHNLLLGHVNAIEDVLQK